MTLEKLRALREALEALKQAMENPFASQGGMSDRVQMRVLGPDGEVKQETDTKGSRNG